MPRQHRDVFFMMIFRWVWAYMGKKRAYFVVGLVLSAVSSAILVVNPLLSRRLIDDVITPGNTAPLIPILATMMAVQLLRLGMRYAMVMLLEANSQQTMGDVRRRLYDIIQHQDYRFQERFRTGNLMTRMTSDLDMLRHSVSWISFVLMDCIVTYIAAFICLGVVNLPLTLSLAAITPLILIITRLFFKIVRPLFISLRHKLTELSTVAQENIEGNRVVKAFAREDYENARFEACNEDFRKTNLKTVYTTTKFQPLLDLLSQSLTVTTLVVGGLFMISGKLTAGEMLVFSSLTWALANPLRTLGMLISDFQRFFAAAGMLIEVFYAQPSIVDRSEAQDIPPQGAAELRFDNVGFSREGKDILSNISFHVKPGQTLGILGSTGSGKTSLVNLILRFYEPTEGDIELNGKNLYAYTLHSLRRQVGLAMQDVFLFSDAVGANIAYGEPELPEEDIVAAAVAADADSFIRKLDDGYDTVVGERGVGLSGGQRQRISLARALAKKPPLLILDDVTSAVDMETEQYIQQQLRALGGATTKLIIAQRVSAFKDADLILVMDGGRIIERGTHQELLAQRGFYHHIHTLQNSMGLEKEVV